MYLADIPKLWVQPTVSLTNGVLPSDKKELM